MIDASGVLVFLSILFGNIGVLLSLSLPLMWGWGCLIIRCEVLGDRQQGGLSLSDISGE